MSHRACPVQDESSVHVFALCPNTPPPTITEENLPSQRGKVFIVTGGYSGIGYELVSILYQAGAKVYLAGRSELKAHHAIESIISAAGEIESAGHIEFLLLVLDDLSTIKASAEIFKSKESQLDALWNNAGVGAPPLGSKTKQGHDLMFGTNCLGPFLFTKLLLPELRAAAMSEIRGSGRVVWTSSCLVDTNAPKGGLIMKNLESPTSNTTETYSSTKAGNWFLASELARRSGEDGIVSVTQNPGSLRTEVWRHTSTWLVILLWPVLSAPRLGAYTELWAGLSPEVTLKNNGNYIIPWGRWHPRPRQDILEALRSKAEGGTGLAAEFWEWCEKETLQYI